MLVSFRTDILQTEMYLLLAYFELLQSMIGCQSQALSQRTTPPFNS